MADSRGGGAHYLHIGGLADRRASTSNRKPYLSGTKVEKNHILFWRIDCEKKNKKKKNILSGTILGEFGVIWTVVEYGPLW